MTLFYGRASRRSDVGEWPNSNALEIQIRLFGENLQHGRRESKNERI
jgi:hypothetical protein